VTRSCSDPTAARPESKFQLVGAKAEQGLACVVIGVMTGSADEGRDWPPHARARSKMQLVEEPIRLAKDLATITRPSAQSA